MDRKLKGLLRNLGMLYLFIGALFHVTMAVVAMDEALVRKK